MLSLRVVSQMGNPPAAALQARFDAGGTIGRSPDCTLVLPDPGRHISREQARIERVSQGYIIRCTGSASPIVLNGAEIGPGQFSPLQAGDTLIVAEYEIAIEGPAPAMPAPAPAPLAARPAAGLSAPPMHAPRGGGVVDDPLAALGLGAASGPIDDPLAAWGKPPAPAARPAAAPVSAVDPLGLGDLQKSALDDSRRAESDIDRLFDLQGASPDALGVGSPLARPASMPNTAASSNPIESLGMTPQALPSALPDHTPEIRGNFRLPEAIPHTNFGFGDPAPSPVAPPKVAPPPAAPVHVPVAMSSAVPVPPRPAPGAAPAPTPPDNPSTGAFLSWNQPEEITPTITISKLMPDTPRPAGAVPPTIQNGGAPEPLAPDQIRAIANEIAERHRVDFEPPPQTRPTDFLNELNRAQVEALRAGMARDKATREPAPAAPAPTQVPATTSRDLEQAQFELLKALLLGLGLTELPRPPLAARGAPPQLSPELMRRLGELVKVATQGTIDLLQARATVKREMKAEVTLIASRDNNPLKFSPDAQAALAHLLSMQSIRGFLDPVPALQDSFDDLLAHQVGFIAGMRAAMQGLIARFDPAVLESRLTRKSVLDSMLPMGRKARLWELFSELFADISREAEDDFEALFGREFVKAYDQQISRMHEEKP